MAAARPEIVGRTKNCVECLKPATSYTGHVTRSDGKHVIAGWCEDHTEMGETEVEEDGHRPGYRGQWTEEMGVRDTYAQAEGERSGST